MSKRKAPGAAQDPIQDNKKFGNNKRIAEFLFELANYERNVNRDTIKYGAYRKAASAISNHDEEITSGDQAKKLPGVGKKIALKIDEFLSTGKLQKLEKIRTDDTSVALNLLTRVAGIGPAKARELLDQGITTIEELRKHEDKLTKAQKIGLKHFEDFEKRIPREEIKKVEGVLNKTLKELDDKYIGTICGSYRRGLATSGDIDLLLTHEDYTSKKPAKSNGHLLKKVVDQLIEEGLVTDTISLGDSKFMGVCLVEDVYRRLDILLLPKDQYFCGVLYFTGSDLFNKAMRTHALEQGFTLNEYTLKPLDKHSHTPLEPLPVSSEEDIFDYIGYEYKEPNERSV